MKMKLFCNLFDFIHAIRELIFKNNRQLDSRLLCNAMGHPGWQKNTNGKSSRVFTQKKNSHNSGENGRIWKKIFKLVLKTM